MIQDSVCCMEMDGRKMETESRHMEGEEKEVRLTFDMGLGG